MVDFEVTLCVTEYRAQVLVDAQGKRYVAPFPAHAKRPIQYGVNTKANSVYFSQYQLLPYARLENYFTQQVGLPIRAGSLFNFNKEAGGE